MENGGRLFLYDFALVFLCENHAGHEIDINCFAVKACRRKHLAVKKIFTVGMIESSRIYDKAVNLREFRIGEDVLLDMTNHWLNAPCNSSSEFHEELVRIEL